MSTHQASAQRTTPNVSTTETFENLRAELDQRQHSFKPVSNQRVLDEVAAKFSELA